MRFRTAFRSGIAPWAAPFLLLLTAAFYTIGRQNHPGEYHHYAPTIVAEALNSLYPFAYASAAALACWESGRLRSSGVWKLAPVRSRHRVAVNALTPVVVLAWLVLLLPCALALALEATAPTPGSLLLPLGGALLCAAHAAVGFAVGLMAPPVVAAPVLAVADWVGVSFTIAVDPAWARYVSGVYGSVGFGELPTLAFVGVPVLLAGSVAVAVLVLWLPRGALSLRVLAAAAVALCGVLGAYRAVADWGYLPPESGGHAPMTCVGTAPRLCAPTDVSTALPQARRDTVNVLGTLRELGVTTAGPALITDSYTGAGGRASAAEWHMNLTGYVPKGDTGYQVVIRALDFRCAEPGVGLQHVVYLWGAERTGQRASYDRRRRAEGDTAQEGPVAATVGRLLAKPDAAQTAWIRHALATCEAGAV
ncbi:hypothetical protein ACIQU5_10555 [Streptomyces sp. NPDC090306]|uniref:hypothetical protein n=1 Tax=Streptomyces sp. NPDC090306 TaxID=3365961 RepID=UPI0037F1A044